MNDLELTRQIGAAIDVDRELGPGLLEAVCEECLCYELTARTIRFEIQEPIPVVYKGAKLECGYRADIVVGSRVIVEIKAKIHSCNCNYERVSPRLHPFMMR